MSKYFLVLVGLIAIYLGLNFLLNQAKPVVNQSAETQPEATAPESNIELSNSGNYVVFSPEILNNTAQTRRVLFFYANWCPTCLPADASFTANMAKLPQDVTLIRVNYNDSETEQLERDLAKKYQIVYQHTFVQLNGQGDVIARWNGGQFAELLANLKTGESL